MIVLGLTGSIAMGKSTAAQMFRRLRIPVYDADKIVHDLVDTGGAAVPQIDKAFSGVVSHGRVDRSALGAHVFANPAALRDLEAILHPLVGRERARFLRTVVRRKQRLVVLDIPLLFETGLDRACTAVAVVSAPVFVQRARVMRRPGMTPARLDAILRRQMPDAQKRRRADFIIPTGLGRAPTFAAIRKMVATLRRSGEQTLAPHHKSCIIRSGRF
jgi:dephospho-CoA kinase